MPLSQDEQIKYKALYLQTAREYVKEMQKNLNFLSTGKESNEVIETLHRAAHSLNSQSIMMSYQSMSAVCSILEKFFKELLGTKRSLSQETLAMLISAAKDMDRCLDAIAQTNQESDLSQDVEKLHILI